MKYRVSEKRALKKLGIEDFRHMTKEKIVKFTSMLPYMDPEVAKAAIAQFPAFSEIAGGMVIQYKDFLTEIVDSNKDSQTAFYDACNKILNSLQAELSKEDLDPAQRMVITDKMIDVAKMIGEKDSEGKNYLLKVGAGFGVAGLVVLALGASILGITVKASSSNSDDDDDDDD